MTDRPTLYFMHDGGDIDGVVRFVPAQLPVVGEVRVTDDGRTRVFSMDWQDLGNGKYWIVKAPK